tara:strand:+ start:259 stop:1125 length:867 start_codon:yes stop_codon:yes gene_type:complete
MFFMPWIYAARPKTLIAVIAPIFLSVIILPDNIEINYLLLFLIFISALAIQIGTNYVNDLHDYLKGTDNQDRIGPMRMLSSGIISEKKMRLGIKIVFLIAVITGFPLVLHGGFPILIVGISSLFLAYMYTAGPVPIAYTPSGEFFVFLYFGIIAVCGSFYILTNSISLLPFLVGMGIGSLNVLLLLINNIRDYENDKNNKKNTMIVKMGLFFGKIESFAALLVAYGSVFLISYYYSTFKLFILYLLSIPLTLSILYDIFKKSGKELNLTLPKISILMILHCFLFYFGF